MVDNDAKLGMRQVKTKSIHSHRERYHILLLRRSSLHVYISPASNLAEVRQKLAKADEVALRQDSTTLQVLGSVFIRTGLEIEEHQ